MKVSFHPEFPQDVLRHAGQYATISSRLESRFRNEVDEAIARIKEQPTAAGHFLTTGSKIVGDVRRRNLVSFPFFVLYGLHVDLLVFGAIIPSATDPLTWLERFTRPD
ncbi:MAG TPA: hypothetical protein VMM36_12490 [Opitutaceae bacterium]|nr:hypothetical protein [Opitutaceae bacterium]